VLIQCIWVWMQVLFRDYVVCILVKNFLELGFWLAGVLCCSECYSSILLRTYLRYWFKTNCCI
jgi:hypothetical protein